MATTDRLLYISSDGLVRQLGFDPTAGDLGGASTLAAVTTAATNKETPVDTDTMPIVEVSPSTVLRHLTWANLKAAVKTYFDTLYLALVTPGTSGNVLTSNGTIWTSAAGGAIVDTNPIVKGSVDATKQMRFEVDGLTTGTTRVITIPNADITIAAAGANSDITSLSAITSINGGALGGFRNRIINGDMRIDQRNGGAAVTPAVVTRAPIERRRRRTGEVLRLLAAGLRRYAIMISFLD